MSTILPLGSAEVPSHIKDPALRKLYASLQSPVPADSAGVVSRAMELEFPDLKIKLSRGHLFRLLDSENSGAGFIFEGEATVNFQPRHELEKFQLSRFIKDSVASFGTSRILWRFINDEAIGEALALPNKGQAATVERDTISLGSLPKVHANLSEDAREFSKTLFDAMLESRGFNLASYLLSHHLDDSGAGQIICAFVADRDPDPFSPLYLYMHDARSHEQVAFFQAFPKRLKHPFYTVCSYPPADYFTAPTFDATRLTKYNGWVQINDSGTLEADMGVDIVVADRRYSTIGFSFSPDLKVARINSEEGDTLDFIQEKDESGFTVILPEHVFQSDTLRLLFHYQGDFLRRHENGTYFLKDPVFWVPRLGYLQRAKYEIVYKYPPKLRLLAIGRKVREWDELGFRLSFYKTYEPAKATTFCLGHFSADTLAPPDDDLPSVEVYSTGRLSHNDRRRVAADVFNSLYYFKSLLSKFPLPVIRIVEAPSSHSQGFPGFVTLAWMGFLDHLPGPAEALRSHEVAHQWFGNLLGWATYHDQWLSEAFAEYLGALYVQWLLREDDSFDQVLRAWRDDVLHQGNIGASIGMQRFGLGKTALRNAEGWKAGPVWMGMRLGQKEAMDYYVQTYQKGAYVLHMLRWLMRDLETGSDERFWNLLADFAMKHRNAEPSTGDFQRSAERHYGDSLDWFFKQWIYDVGVPTYRWSSDTQSAYPEQESPQSGVPLANFDWNRSLSGESVVVRAEQEEVPDGFRMPVPVTVQYADGSAQTRRLWVDKNGGEVVFPPNDSKVLKVVFNEGGAVLCRMREE